MSLDDLLPLLFVAVFVVNAVMRGRRSRRGGTGRTPSRPTPPGPNAPPPAAETRTVRPGDAGREAAPHTAASGDEGGGSPADDLRRRIEEAQRRVREAMGEEVADTSLPPGPRTPDARRTPDLPPPAAPAGTPRPAPRVGPPRVGPPRVGPPRVGPGRGGRVGGGLGREGAAPEPRPPGGPTAARGLGREGGPARPQPSPAPSTTPFLGREGGPARPRRDAARGDRSAPRVARLGGAAASARLRAAKGLGRDRDDIVRGFIWSVVFEEPVALRRKGRRSISPRR